MSTWSPRTILARARSDPAFRQQFLAQNLDRLLEALEMMRRAERSGCRYRTTDPEGADLAVKLADRLQSGDPGPQGRLNQGRRLVLSRCFALPFRENPL